VRRANNQLKNPDYYSSQINKGKKRLRLVGAGGTFDEFHKGHRALLLKAFELGNSVQIGLCTDRFARRLSKDHEFATYEERLSELQRFLKTRNLDARAEIIPLDDPYGPAITNEEIEAIVVSKETEPVAHVINTMRKRNRLPPLGIYVIDMVPAENHVAISTTRIRQGEIDREGHLLEK
jgi:pantetheine-phosphate adenylyltransferase